MKIKIVLLIFFIITTFYSCSISSDNLIGIYISKNLINNIDTLRILNNGTYSRDLHRKVDNSLVYHNTGKWNYEDGRICLHDFLQDEDNNYSKEVSNFKDVLITCDFPVERRAGKIAIYYRLFTETSYYEKQQ